ncbi:hypothetical protein ZTR_04012 [Talaromyces verruculosus]|nr:hypothetical protein ZTR_04012 [Talaromyces verruculosus]
MSNSLPPASVIASWPAPDYIHPVRRGPGLLIVNVLFSSLAFILTVLRVYTRAFITATIGLDDVLAVLALAFAIAMCTATSIAAAHFGWDLHQWDVPYAWIPASLKYRMIFEITFSVSSTLTKVSLLWFCRRLLGSSAKSNLRRLNWSLIGAMVLLVIMGLLFIFTTLLNCIPIKASFDVLPDYPYHCINGGQVVVAASVINVFTDFMTAVVPMPLIWKLNLPRRQRLAVIGIFGIGVVVTVASSVRTYYAWFGAFGTYDTSWWGWATCLSASIEINLGLMCASAPALRPLTKAIWPRLLGSSGYGDGYGYSHHRFNNPKPWPPSSLNRSANRNIRMGSGGLITKEVGTFGRRDSTNGSGIVRTVELETFYEDRKDVTYGGPATANSATPKPMMEARNAYGRGPVMKPSRSCFMDRRRDSFPGSRNLKELYDDDEAAFALERLV